MSKDMSAENLSKPLICPVGTCQTANLVNAEVCERCGLPLQAFARVSIYPSLLFNMGLAKVKENQIKIARDIFSSVVYWCPKDAEARNAFAMACFAMGDYATAKSQWEIVLKQSPSDAIAKQSLSALDGLKLRQEKIPNAEQIRFMAKHGRPKRKRRKK